MDRRDERLVHTGVEGSHQVDRAEVIPMLGELLSTVHPGILRHSNTTYLFVAEESGIELDVQV